MLPQYWDQTLARRELNLDDSRRIKTSGVRGVRTQDAWDSDRDVHEQSHTFIWPPMDKYGFMAAFENVPDGLWPGEADELFGKLADEYRGYAPYVFQLVVGESVPNLAAIVRDIVETDRTGRYFTNYSAADAEQFWNNPPRIPTWIPTLPTRESDESRVAAHWAAGFAFTRMRRRIRWEPFPLRNCTLCGTQMRHCVDQSFRRNYRYGLEAPPRWCVSCAGKINGPSTAKEVQAALRAYVEATGVVPVNLEMVQFIPNNRSGQVRDVMAATRTTVQGQWWLQQVGLWPWGKALVSAGVVDGFVETKRGLQSESKDGHWCKSIFERQVDDFLTSHQIPHEHEPRWPKHPEFNSNGLKRADWRLPDGTMVEAAGMMDDPIYAVKMQQKSLLAGALSVPLLLLTPDMVLQLDQVFEQWMAPGRERQLRDQIPQHDT
jgi:hypothetical protein